MFILPSGDIDLDKSIIKFNTKLSVGKDPNPIYEKILQILK